MAEPSNQASWVSPTSTGRPTVDGKRVYRAPAPQVTWWIWAGVVLVSLGDLALQGHDLSALRFGLVLLIVTGFVFACTLWPRVVAREDGMTVHNPFRRFDIPWGAVKQIQVADSVQVRCARTPPKKDKTVYSWALASPRRANARAEMRARQWERRGGRSRPAGWDQMPEEAKEIARMQPADLIARQLALIAREAQAGADGTGTAVPVVSGGWDWQPFAAIFVPAAAFAIAMLVK